MIRQGIREKSDERILGSGEFVEQLIQQSDEERRKQFFGRQNQQRAIDYIRRECKAAGVDIKALKAGSRRRKISELRARLIEKLIEEFGFSLAHPPRVELLASQASAIVLNHQQCAPCVWNTNIDLRCTCVPRVGDKLSDGNIRGMPQCPESSYQVVIFIE